METSPNHPTSHQPHKEKLPTGKGEGVQRRRRGEISTPTEMREGKTVSVKMVSSIGLVTRGREGRRKRFFYGEGKERKSPLSTLFSLFSSSQ